MTFILFLSLSILTGHHDPTLSYVLASQTPTDKWRNSDGGLESLLRFPTIPTTATARTRQGQQEKNISKHYSQSSCPWSPASWSLAFIKPSHR